MKPDQPDERAFYRNRLSNSCIWLVFAFAAIYMLDILERESRTGAQTAVLVLVAAMMTVFLIPVLRVPFRGVVVTRGQLRVRNVMRTHTLRWDQVERFELARYDPWPRIGVAVLKDGKRVPLAGIQWAPLSHFAERTVSALNERLAEGSPETACEPTTTYPSLSSSAQDRRDAV